MNKSFLLLLLFFATLIPAKFANADQNSVVLKVKIIGVKDGDTVEALYYQFPMSVRLEHIDAPEKRQPFGTKSKERLSDLCFGKNATIISNGRNGSYDSRGRLIAEIFLEDGTNVNKEMVKFGLAWHYKKYSSDADYARLEETAKKNKLGLWSDPNSVSPWSFRK
ncbi:thermonuclease family protein [Chryseobacterium suipulveris]|uniref:Thermonuclease family protein n=1 Tax=Chryseobacterium suipulveris TaxID=2929800 RepID=A0ABY4BP34_9FLAO|nr:thermonuclease family protein [Chryseobacterium suipulveris]UOE40644.1 thermonuclease family protein [Chryseobacterium suipulveris]